jgi:DNA mismatch repair protein MutS2
VIATSHYDQLKTYASTTEGVASAAFGFELTTFAPTYQLLYGSPGTQPALEIAGPARPEPVGRRRGAREPERARGAARRAPRRRSITTCAALEHEHRLAARERETLQDAEARMQQREDALRQREETFKRG